MSLDAPGLFGKRCVKMFIPRDAKKDWTGWRQDVPVEPGKTYLFAAWLKCQDLEGGLQLHAHYRNAAGELCETQKFAGAAPAISGTKDWTLMFGMFTMPPDIAHFQLHLTMLATGTAWHDGVVLAEVTHAVVGKLEARLRNLTDCATWQVNAITKVFQDDVPPREITPARISAARNEKEPLQIAVRSPQAVKQIKVEVDAPVHANGKRLNDVQVNVVGYVPVDHPSSYYSASSPAWHRKYPRGAGGCDGWAGMWPDPLLPRSPFDLAANTTQPIWLTVSVPKDAAAGDYRGKVRLVANGATLKEIPFTVHVWDFALPDESHVKAIYDVRISGAWWALPGKTQTQVRQELWRFMAERRVCPDTIRPEPLFKYENGKVTADFTEFDKAAEYYFNVLKFPHAYTPWHFYLFGWGHPPPQIERLRAAAATGFSLAADLADYLTKKGLPFCEAHHDVGRIVRDCLARHRTLEEVTAEELQQFHPLFAPDVVQLLSVDAAVASRRVEGGTAPQSVQQQLAKAKRLCSPD